MVNNIWIFFSFMAMISTSIGMILLKMIDINKYDFLMFIICTYIMAGIAAAIYLVYDKNIRAKFINNCDIFLIMFIILFGGLRFINNFTVFHALKYAPNIGYSHIIINLNIVLTLLASYFLFKQTININSFIGILFCLIGIIIISLNAHK
jgi:drug/metabolite transporter (DMT)-like permease